MGLFRGDNVKMRYRRLDMECTRTKTEAARSLGIGLRTLYSKLDAFDEVSPAGRG